MGRLKIYDSTTAGWKYVSKTDKAMPSGDVVGTTDTQALTNKTIDGDLNTVQDLPYSAIKGVAWTSFTPSWTNLTVGDGTNTGYYVQIGKTVHFRTRFVFGATSSMGSQPLLTLPVNAVAGFEGILGSVMIVDYGTASYGGLMRGNRYVLYDNGSVLTFPSSTAPMTWATNDELIISGTYEAA